MSNLITKIATAAMFAGLLATSAQAQSTKPFAGVVLVAAVPLDEIYPQALRETAKPQFKRGQIVILKSVFFNNDQDVILKKSYRTSLRWN